MTVFPPAETLRRGRPLLLATEAVGLLHMTGKASAEFLREQGGQIRRYDELRWHALENPPFPWGDLLAWVENKFQMVDGVQIGWPNTLAEFLTKHRKRDAGLLGLLQAAHGINSGIEKNLPGSTADYLKQDTTHMWLSSAFGYPQRNLLADPPELLGTHGWNTLLAEIRRILAELKQVGETNNADIGAWWSWRNAAIGPESVLRREFSSTVAETRLPNNDVTLWDQSYVAAALFKSAVAGAILEGISFPWNDRQIKQTTQWRLLTVGIGADHYEARAVRIGDWLGAREAVHDFFGRVQRLAETDLAFGSLLYKDSTTAVLSFPGERSNASKAVGLDSENWRCWFQEQIDTFAQELKLETPPYCHISPSTRSVVPMVKEMREARHSLTVPVHRSWNISWEVRDGHVCPVCFVRNNGKPKDKQAPCRVCAERRLGRLDAWLGGKLGSDTLWLSEVADANDRIALLTLSLDLEPWLDGTRLDSLRTQTIREWRMHNPRLGGQTNPIDSLKPFDSLSEYVAKQAFIAKGGGWKYDQSDRVLRSLSAGYAEEAALLPQSTPEDLWKSFFGKIVEDRSYPRPTWGGLKNDERAQWLAHQLFCKLASPGRVYRFWRQAQDFFESLLHEFREISAQNANRWRVRRLILKPDSATGNWRHRELYDGRCHDAPISLLYDSSKEAFITACNMARALQTEEPGESLRNEELLVKPANDNDNDNQKLKVADVRDEVGPLGVYHPVIPLEMSPLRFRSLVPLEAASACVDVAVEAWKREFAHVWDRLPLRLGIVAFPQKLPFQALIEVARNIEEGLESPRSETWRVVERDARDGVVALNLQRPDSGHELRTVPVRLPDGRADVFYPYFAVEDRLVRFPRDFQHPGGCVYRHARELAPGNGVKVSPARIATVFLDAAGLRFERIKPRPLSEWRQMRKAWSLLDSMAPSTSALRSAWGTLAERKTAWRNAGGDWLPGGKQAWIDLVRAVLNDRIGVRGADLDTLIQAAVDSVLEWAIEWHLSVLKKRLGDADDGG
ncbi:MAG: CRISPR-associated protein Csx11 [Candidatus Binataceae bacterium]